jgi:acyl-CoA thioesterase I
MVICPAGLLTFLVNFIASNIAMRQIPYKWISFLSLSIGLLLSPISLADTNLTEHSRSQVDPSQTILVMGDSLSAAYGINPADGWVNRLRERLAPAHYRTVNASVSGETSQGGQQRLAALLKREAPSVVIIELGANDGLRGLDPQQIQTNLAQMISMSLNTKARVLLIGIDLPANYGDEYRHSLARVYANLKVQYKVAFLDNLLKSVPIREENFQADHLHPVAAVQPNIEESVYRALKPLLTAGRP